MVQARRVHSLGIDLAVGPKTTAMASIWWTPAGPTVDPPRVGCTDADLLAALVSLAGADRAGVDVPFGWPVTFVEAVAAHRSGQRWPGRGQGSAEHRAQLRLRVTDRQVAAVTGRQPLSVAFDKLGATAARWAHLADELAAQGRPVDRAGRGPVVEVYPAAARLVWGLGGLRSLPELVERAPWLRISPDVAASYAGNEHAFDALIAALVARAAQLQMTTTAQAAHLDIAQQEGWIHLPLPGSLTRLADDSDRHS